VGCTSFTSTSDCITKTAQCFDDDTITKTRWLGTKNSVAYTCGAGKQAYLQNQLCLSNATSNTRAVCGSTPPITALPTTDLCKAVNDRVTCITNITRFVCGSDAADFMASLSPKLLAPQVQAQNTSCFIPGSSNAVTLWTNFYVLLTVLLSAVLSLLL